MSPPPPCAPSGLAPDVEFVVPVYNEDRELVGNIRRLHTFLSATFPWTFLITIADNASTDRTWPIGQQLAIDLPGVRAVRLPSKGRGGALHAVWSGSDATVLAYLDVDLSTGLPALLPLVAPLMSGHSDLAIGTRLSASARVVRGPKRELISRGYNTLLHATLRTGFSDAQCGFKAIRADRAHVLLPLVADTAWFFDTELLVLAERAGLRIYEVPVDWVDDADSRVDLWPTAMADLRGIARLTIGLATGRIPVPAVGPGLHHRPPSSSLAMQVLRFAAVGVLSTAAYVLLYLLLRTTIGAQAANAVALLVTAVGNTAANRRYTFQQRQPAGALRHHLQSLAVFLVA
ncbi:MAG: glycosyltransferase, partial [Frankiaceae bacterium]